MQAAIEQFMKQEAGKKVLILGDMLELGDFSDEEHRKVISSLRAYDVKTILVGHEFSKAGNDQQDTCFMNTEDAIAWLAKNPIQDAYILVKGSRGIALEKLLDYL
jgi:UDP-N-acetylmuramoyl-tripeptide--D-alanyl-D-alanine ligase